MKTLAQLLPQLSGARSVGALEQAIARVHTDTRSLQPGDLFVALKGERFDAHDFLPQARSAGAVAAVAHAGLAAAGPPLSLASIEHVFTHFRLRIQPLWLRIPDDAPTPSEANQAWVGIGNLADHGMPAPVARLLDGLYDGTPLPR